MNELIKLSQSDLLKSAQGFISGVRKSIRPQNLKAPTGNFTRSFKVQMLGDKVSIVCTHEAAREAGDQANRVKLNIQGIKYAVHRGDVTFQLPNSNVTIRTARSIQSIIKGISPNATFGKTPVALLAALNAQKLNATNSTTSKQGIDKSSLPVKIDGNTVVYSIPKNEKKQWTPQKIENKNNFIQRSIKAGVHEFKKHLQEKARVTITKTIKKSIMDLL